jgi:hypothetical protein
MKSKLLTQNGIMALLTVMTILACITFGGCTKIEQEPIIKCWLNEDITDTDDEKLIFHLQAEFTPTTYGEPLPSFDYYLTLQATADGLPTIYKDVHLTDESFRECNSKMVFLKRFDFDEHIDAQTQKRYTISVSEIQLQMSIG